MSRTETELPNVAQVLAQVLERVPRERHPLLIALAERLAADRYRGWSADVPDPTRSQLLGCAHREEEIARRVEALYPDAAAVQEDILARNTDLQDVNHSLFAGRPVEQQFTIQAQGERLGAATWRAFAHQSQDPKVRATFLGCADLEEQSAAVLESLLRVR